MAATDDLSALLANLPNATLLTDTMKQDALNAARIPDSTGVWPGGTGYVPTYDIYFAAIRLIGWLMAQPVVRQSSSEGTSVAVDAPNWGGLISYYESMSPICSINGSTTILQEVVIPDTRHLIAVDMHDRGEYNDNVDTDLG